MKNFTILSNNSKKISDNTIVLNTHPAAKNTNIKATQEIEINPITFSVAKTTAIKEVVKHSFSYGSKFLIKVFILIHFNRVVFQIDWQDIPISY